MNSSAYSKTVCQYRKIAILDNMLNCWFICVASPHHIIILNVFIVYGYYFCINSSFLCTIRLITEIVINFLNISRHEFVNWSSQIAQIVLFWIKSKVSFLRCWLQYQYDNLNVNIKINRKLVLIFPLSNSF